MNLSSSISKPRQPHNHSIHPEMKANKSAAFTHSPSKRVLKAIWDILQVITATALNILKTMANLFTNVKNEIANFPQNFWNSVNHNSGNAEQERRVRVQRSMLPLKEKPTTCSLAVHPESVKNVPVAILLQLLEKFVNPSIQTLKIAYTLDNGVRIDVDDMGGVTRDFFSNLFSSLLRSLGIKTGWVPQKHHFDPA